MTLQADVHEFNAVKNKLPGDRHGIAAVGPYILELYLDPVGSRPRAVIEVNKKHGDKDYSKETNIWFNTEDADERQFEDPEQAAQDEFNRLKQANASDVEQYV